MNINGPIQTPMWRFPEETPSGSQALGDEFRPAIDTIPGLVWTSLPDGHVDYLNQRWIEFTGLTSDESLGCGWMAAVHPDDLAPLMANFPGQLAVGNPGETEARLRRFDGVYRWFLFRAVALHDEAGNVVKWCGTSIEIEDRRRTEALLAGENRILEMIARGQALADTLDALCHLVGELSPSSLCSILLLDWTEFRFRLGAAPNLPDSYNQAMDGRVFATSSGACERYHSAAAVYTTRSCTFPTAISPSEEWEPAASVAITVKPDSRRFLLEERAGQTGLVRVRHVTRR